MVTMVPESLPQSRIRNSLFLAGLAVFGLALFVAGGFAPAYGQSAATDTLVLVNGEPVTAGDLDSMIMEAHKSFDMASETSGIVSRLLTKRVNDILIVQDAYAAGMDEEPEMVELLDGRRRSHAIRAFARDNLVLSGSAPADSVQAFFERWYWQIQVRRISVRTWQEAADLKVAVMAGADMDSLARELSLDTKKPRGGLYNLLYWIDLETKVRDHAGGLGVGEYSEIFPYNDAFTFIRVEEIVPVDPDSFSRFEDSIAKIVLKTINQQEWEDFVDGLLATMDLEESMAGMTAIVADSSLVLKGEFLKEDPGLVIQLAGGRGVTGTELRKAVSHEVMQNATAPFGENLNKARRKEISELVLAQAAEEAGYFENPEVEQKVAQDLDQALIEAYLSDTVASRITFKRSEFDEFYEVNKEKFRGPEEVRIDILILHDQDKAEEAASRLADGADFGFIFAEFNPGQEATLGKSRFIKKDQLSQPFRDQLANMKPGDSSGAFQMSMGWVIFKLVEVKEGTLQPMENVEMEIRKVIYQTKFNKYLDEHLALLRENSEIVNFEDRIDAYVLSGEQGN